MNKYVTQYDNEVFEHGHCPHCGQEMEFGMMEVDDGNGNVAEVVDEYVLYCYGCKILFIWDWNAEDSDDE